MKKYFTVEEYFNIKENSHHRKKYIIIIEIVLVSIIAFSSFTLIKWGIDNFRTWLINRKIEKNINLSSTNTDGILINPPSNRNSSYYYYVSFPFIEADFKSLLATNNETVAFIRVKNTLVNYPVVQASDNKYYLKHSFDKSSNKAGWIFMDYRNNPDNLDDNTIIYGHRRVDGTMFGSLENSLSADWQEKKDNYVIFLSTPKESMLFQIFSIYTIKEENYYLTINFNNNEEKQKWIDTMKKRNTALIDTEVNVNDKFLTLSTCYGKSGKRLVIQAKLIKSKKI